MRHDQHADKLAALLKTAKHDEATHVEVPETNAEGLPCLVSYRVSWPVRRQVERLLAARRQERTS